MTRAAGARLAGAALALAAGCGGEAGAPESPASGGSAPPAADAAPERWVCEAERVLQGASDMDHAGWALATGDWDGGGVADLAVGTYLPLDVPRPSSGFVGSAYLWLGPFDSGEPCPDDRPALRIRGEAPGDRFGWGLGFVGDLDADGRDDLAVGAVRAPAESERGVLYLFLSGDGGTGLDGAAPGAASASRASVAVAGGIEGERLGHAVIGIGDWDGGGTADLAVAAPGSFRATDRLPGRVYLLSGEALAAAAAGERGGRARVAAGDVAFARVEGDRAGDVLGWSLARVGVEAGAAPIAWAAGAPEIHPGPHDVRRFPSTEERPRRGYVRVFLGPDREAPRLEGDQSLAAFGVALAGGSDVDGDGDPDLAVGAPLWDAGGLADAGRLTVHDASERGAPLVEAHGTQETELFAFAVALAPDADGDGRAEAVAGSNRYGAPEVPRGEGRCRCTSTDATLGGPIAGRATMVAGGGGGVLARWIGEDPSDSAGCPVLALPGAGPAGEDLLAIAAMRWPFHGELEGERLAERGRVYLVRPPGRAWR